jgi:hypothetical protein
MTKETDMKLISALFLAGVLAAPALVTTSRPAAAANSCTAGLTLALHPGLPPSVRHGGMPVARDLPRRTFTVSVPLYSGAEALSQFVASPVPEYPATPYLQTGVAEYRTTASRPTVEAWYRSAFAGCGWHVGGTMGTNASVLSSGIAFVSNSSGDLTVDMTFGDAPSGGTYIAYAAEEITYPKRPARSYLHGPFSEVRIALQRNPSPLGHPASHVVHTTTVNRPAIVQLVRAINAIKDYYTAPVTCAGGFRSAGPAWLSFVRPNGSMVRAYEDGPGACGGLAVNGVRWLIDPGKVWNLIRSTASSTSQSGATGKVSTGGSVSSRPWRVQRVLAVRDVAGLCASHSASRFIASVRGFLTAMPLQGPGGGFVGRLFTARNPRAFFAGDREPFVQVWGTRAWDPRLTGRQVIFHGLLVCDTSTYRGELPGWQGSITPDRYSLTG